MATHCRSVYYRTDASMRWVSATFVDLIPLGYLPWLVSLTLQPSLFGFCALNMPGGCGSVASSEKAPCRGANRPGSRDSTAL